MPAKISRCYEDQRILEGRGTGKGRKEVADKYRVLSASTDLALVSGMNNDDDISIASSDSSLSFIN